MSAVVTVCAFVLAAIGLVEFALRRPPGKVQFMGTVVVGLAALALVIFTIASGAPKEPITFWGYSISLLLLPPAAWVLARMEPTRFGSLIVGCGALIVPVLVLRLGQTWGVH
ncbi:hypothetical protein [Catelliglobosispora koreensis]|uniref:hypothetical protein n=1 Tax=Catelliglobosispora koreensis TaxID=129052 RepID=UPI000379B674|nr:hypothetical protein [Catelliglobosispora koreensis]